VLANDDVNFEIASGEIVALLGENGAGKTTLMNVLYGLYSADEGEILLDGEPLVLTEPSDAIEAGIGMVHQHFMLVPVFSVAENVILGVEPAGKAGWIDQKAAKEKVREISSRYRLEIDPDAIVEDLPVGIQQRVEIIKVLLREARFVVFDEPTAVLTPQEVEGFIEIANGLKADGKGIIFISHKLKEALEIADRIVVMRDGKTVGEVSPADVTEEGLAELMVGRPVDLVVDKSASDPTEPVLVLDHLTVLDDRSQEAVRDVSFQVRAGEIVGIAGVQGNGQTELIESITGVRPSIAGTVTIGETDVTTSSPRDIHRMEVAHIPEDRQRSGLVLDFAVYENMVLDSYYDEPFSHGIRMDWGAVRESAAKLVEEYDVKTPGIDVPLSGLSGGNQQKVIVAREFNRDVNWRSHPSRQGE